MDSSLFKNRLDKVFLALGISQLKDDFKEVELLLQDDSIWQCKDRIKELTTKRSRLEQIISPYQAIVDSLEILDEFSQDELGSDYQLEQEQINKNLEFLENRLMFSGKYDELDAYVELQSGAGGTDAQDWTEMMLRMYLRYFEKKGFKAEILECSQGDEAGIKGATIKVEGDLAYGWLKNEHGIHRMVRKSPFNANNKRQTSFSGVSVTPDLPEQEVPQLNPKDLRIDTYRASGAGGQHVNKTDSAVRITHLPSGIVVQCQNNRSQHQNKDQAMKQLSAKLYKMEKDRQNDLKKSELDKQHDISWGNQIRSYVLDLSTIKDLRTGFSTSNVKNVLDGDLDPIIISTLNHQ